MLAWQIDHIVGIPERDLFARVIREREFFGIDNLAIAVAASERGRAVGAYRQPRDGIIRFQSGSLTDLLEL